VGGISLQIDADTVADTVAGPVVRKQGTGHPGAPGEFNSR
jgi:hypothetical protein